MPRNRSKAKTSAAVKAAAKEKDLLADLLVGVSRRTPSPPTPPPGRSRRAKSVPRTPRIVTILGGGGGCINAAARSSKDDQDAGIPFMPVPTLESLRSGAATFPPCAKTRLVEYGDMATVVMRNGDIKHGVVLSTTTDLKVALQTAAPVPAATAAGTPDEAAATARFWESDPRVLVGEKVRVLWKDGKKFDGTVTLFDPSDGLHQVTCRLHTPTCMYPTNP